MMGELLA